MAANTFISTATTDMASRPATSMQRFTTYSDIRKDTPVLFGDNGEFQLKFDSTRNCMVVDGQGIGMDLRTQMSNDRYSTGPKYFGGKLPVLTAGTLFSTDNDFVLIGTNAVAGDATNNLNGRGVKIQSHGADGDFTVLRPDSGANRSPWQAAWLSQSKPRFECVVWTDSVANSSTAAVIYAGLKLTNVDTAATDADQVYFRAQDTVNSGRWGVCWSIATVLTTTDTGVSAAVANTAFYLVIDIDASRIARCYINGTLVATTTALTTAITFIPFIGVRAAGAAASKILYVQAAAMSMSSS
jgi:hypothetical protein